MKKAHSGKINRDTFCFLCLYCISHPDLLSYKKQTPIHNFEVLPFEISTFFCRGAASVSALWLRRRRTSTNSASFSLARFDPDLLSGSIGSSDSNSPTDPNTCSHSHSHSYSHADADSYPDTETYSDSHCGARLFRRGDIGLFYPDRSVYRIR